MSTTYEDVLADQYIEDLFKDFCSVAGISGLKENRPEILTFLNLHSYIESWIFQLLIQVERKKLPLFNEDKFKKQLEKMTFYERWQLLDSLLCLDDELNKYISALNITRNKLAHGNYDESLVIFDKPFFSVEGFETIRQKTGKAILSFNLLRVSIDNI